MNEFDPTPLPGDDGPLFDPLAFAGMTEPELLARLRLARHEDGQWVELSCGLRACCIGRSVGGGLREYVAAGYAYTLHGGRQWIWSVMPPEGWVAPASQAEQLSLFDD